MINETVVLYHKNCADGFLAAATLKSRSEQMAKAEYIPVQYGDITADNYDEDWAHQLAGRDVWIVDFSVKPEIMERISEDAEFVFWLDHHKTAFEDYGLDIEKVYSGDLLQDKHPDLIVSLDNGKSGAMLAWEFAYSDTPAPCIVKYVDDRDRWVWAYPETRDVMAGFFALQPWNLDAWADLLTASKENLIAETRKLHERGAVLNKSLDSDIEMLMHGATPALINGSQKGLIVNAPHKYASELGHKLAELSGTYALVWRSEGRRVFCSLRGAEGYDVSEIARMFGGGGHAGAAGFECDLTMLETFMVY